MKKKTRLIVLLSCIACFLIIAPILVLYSMGYRFDFEKMKITATGGIYVKTFPTAEQIIIDAKTTKKPSLFSDSVFVQSLIPNNHTVLIKKYGYFDYFKILPVVEEKVTKLENVLLIKKNIQFEVVTDLPAQVSKTQSPFDKLEKFIIKNNNLYYSASPENINITAAQKLIPVLKGLMAFSVMNNNLVWLGLDGYLYQSDLAGISVIDTKGVPKNAIKLTIKPREINKKGFYKIVSDNQNVLVIDNNYLLLLDTATNDLSSFYNQVKDAKISPDGKNIIYRNDNNIYVSLLSVKPVVSNPIYNSTEKIDDFYWLNNDYIVFTSGDKIAISEIDYRGNVNTINLPAAVSTSLDKKIDIKSPRIFFNQQSGKLYVLVSDTLLLSEKITQ